MKIAPSTSRERLGKSKREWVVGLPDLKAHETRMFPPDESTSSANLHRNFLLVFHRRVGVAFAARAPVEYWYFGWSRNALAVGYNKNLIWSDFPGVDTVRAASKLWSAARQIRNSRRGFFSLSFSFSGSLRSFCTSYVTSVSAGRRTESVPAPNRCIRARKICVSFRSVPKERGRRGRMSPHDCVATIR